jgi:hypothetical protein
MLLMTGVLAGAFYWNDQLSFGVELPTIFPRCTGVVDAPDRGVYVLFNRRENCPDLTKESLFDYVERKKIPSMAVIAWYNTVEGFNNSAELAKAYCAEGRYIYRRKVNYGDVYYCFFQKENKMSLRGFVQLHKNSQSTEAVNVEFYLNSVEHAGEYWRVVDSLVSSSP